MASSCSDGQSVVVTRLTPDLLRHDANSADSRAIAEAYGDEWPWAWSAPLVFRALASPLSGQPMPAPADDQGANPRNLGYWSALLNLLVYRLGWRRIDYGLYWWYSRDKPSDSIELAMLRCVWEGDGLLERMALLSSTSYMAPPDASGIADGVFRPSELVVRWARSLRGTESVSHYDGLGPFGMHLENGFHIARPMHDRHSGAVEPILTRTSPTERRAVLMIDSMVGWYRALERLGGSLPDIGDRSWQVDVVVRQVGWMGTYRRSRVSGIWFTGPHRYHLPGSPDSEPL